MVKQGKVVKEDEKNIHQGEETPTVEGQRSPGGHEPSPESDDNALDAAQEVGLYPEADEEHPKEVGLDKQIGPDKKSSVSPGVEDGKRPEME